MSIKLVVGLGNIGAEYHNTRHNAGFMLLDELAGRARLVFRDEKKFSGAMAMLNGVRLLKPSTYMNHSGCAVGAVANFYRIQACEILVIHDEMDISCGALKIKQGGGNGGHNGLKDIQAHLGSADFWRLRVGIGHPIHRSEVVSFVLKKPMQDEQLLIDAAIDDALNQWDVMMAGDFAAAQRILHARSV